MAGLGGHGTRELATPLVSTSQPAGALQQELSWKIYERYSADGGMGQRVWWNTDGDGGCSDMGWGKVRRSS